jgi:hypothetical protein
MAEPRRSRLYLVALLAPLIIAGCTSYVAPEERTIPSHRSLVFGAISRHPKGFGSSDEANVIDEATGLTFVTHPLKESGGPFYWSLPPGNYAILDIRSRSSFLISWLTGITTWGANRVDARFRVPSAQKMIYIGTLDLSSEKSVILNDFDSALLGLHTEFPSLKGEPITELMQLESPR